jgi:cell fate regulator YaaT (PSP1 superfamily)
MIKVLKVKFYDTGKTQILKVPEDLNLNYGERVVIKTERGKELVKVISLFSVNEETFNNLNVDIENLPEFLGTASEEDLNKFVQNQLFSQEAIEFCKKQIEEHGLPMKLVKAYATLDKKRIVFYFTAESRVDFRQLVRDLASHFKTRIELRQIGVRDEIKITGSMGMCGKECCCKEFLECFDSISLTMARNQGLPANPAKLSGACGRLMCCFKFEEKTYSIKEKLPEIGETVKTSKGTGIVLDINVPLEIVTIELETGVKTKIGFNEFIDEETWKNYLEELSRKVDDKLKCFTKVESEAEENL